jgi:hypothetical protein
MRSFLFALLLFPFASNAGCLDIAELKTKDRYINISDGGCGTLSITVAGIDKNGMLDQESLDEYPFAEECTLSPSMDEISCHPNGRTPLAGAKYKVKQFGTYILDCGESGKAKLPNTKYVCVAGCSKLAPKFLYPPRDTCE